MRGRLRRRGDENQRAATLELFYDLVFVFSITQVTHLLLEHLTWEGAGQAGIVLLAVWWSWNYTTWATNELNPETNPVRLLLIGLMVGSLLMAIALPRAFEDRGLLFAGAYLAIQVGRHAFLTFVAADRGTVQRRQAMRILVWFLVAGVFWIGGGIADGEGRTWLWLAALALDYLAPLALFPVPGLPRLRSGSWHLVTSHFAERFGLFVIAALGETIIMTGATTAQHDLTVASLAGLVSAFAGTAALWWLYFTSTQQLGERAMLPTTTRTRRARDLYTYGHVPLIGGIILTAVGDELVVAHPLEPVAPAGVLAVAGGPALFLLSQLVLELRATGRAAWSRPIAVGACAAIALFGGALPALAVSAALVTVLVGVALLDEPGGRARALAANPTPPAPLSLPSAR